MAIRHKYLGNIGDADAVEYGGGPVSEVYDEAYDRRYYVVEYTYGLESDCPNYDDDFGIERKVGEANYEIVMVLDKRDEHGNPRVSVQREDDDGAQYGTLLQGYWDGEQLINLDYETADLTTAEEREMIIEAIREDFESDRKNIECELTVYRAHFDPDENIVEYYDWVEWDQLAEQYEDPEEWLEEARTTDDPLHKAYLLEEIGGYWGWHEIDHYPLLMPAWELKQRWEEREATARRNPIRGRRPAKARGRRRGKGRGRLRGRPR
jgi:hypothetical protein